MILNTLITRRRLSEEMVASLPKGSALTAVDISDHLRAKTKARLTKLMGEITSEIWKDRESSD